MKCGECTVCCTLSVVEELNKKAGERCFNCIGNGCSIYEKRPQVCKDFECAYLQGGNNIELRPDKCGVMFWKKTETIFCGAMMPGITITDVALKQIVSFKNQGYSLVLLKIGEKPHIELSEGHDREQVIKEYISSLNHGNI